MGARGQAVIIKSARHEHSHDVPRGNIHDEENADDCSPMEPGLDAIRKQLGDDKGHRRLEALHHVPHKRINEARTEMEPRHHATAWRHLLDEIELVSWPHKLHGWIA